MLAKANLSTERRQRHIAPLLEAMPENLKAAEAAEAAAAAAAEVRQTEMPSPEKVHLFSFTSLIACHYKMGLCFLSSPLGGQYIANNHLCNVVYLMH